MIKNTIRYIRHIFVVLSLFLIGSVCNSAGFDGWRAFDLLEYQCALGARVPDSPIHAKCLVWMEGELVKSGFEAKIMKHSAYSSMLAKTITIKNLFGIINPAAKKKILFSAHWDTRPIADKDPNPNLTSTPISGANDGASGVAVLLELANAIFIDKELHNALKTGDTGLILAFYDAEDLGNSEHPDEFCLGSKAFAADIPPDLTFTQGINIDMIGDKDLEITFENESFRRFPDFCTKIWEIGMRYNPRIFIPKPQFTIIDDHASFFSKKIPYINIIDFTYTYWHTTSDTPDKCSPDSLQIIGNTLLTYLSNEIKKEKKTLEK